VEEYARAVLLGLLQALTEFLPVSSSGHLVLAEHVLGDRATALTFDVGLHAGTTLAVLGYFWRDWLAITRALAGDTARHRASVAGWSPASRLGLWIALGTVPAVIAGALVGDRIESGLREPWLVAVLLLTFSLPLAASERMAVRRAGLDAVRAADALAVGVVQALALAPGVSRSGITISAARALGFDRSTATRLSFLLSAPAIVAAATLSLGQAVRGDEAVAWGPLLAGAAVSAVAGIAVIHWLLGYVRNRTMWPFIWYRVALGAFVLTIAAVRAT
jgi:undecaprenyl-diphosphatase